MSTSTVAAVAAYERTHRGARLDCEMDSSDEDITEWTVPVTVRFYDPVTFRFELDATPEVPDERPSPEYDEAAVTAPVDLSVTEANGELTLTTEALAVVTSDREDGERRWSRRTGTPNGESREPGVRGPPTPVAGGVFAVAGDGMYAFGPSPRSPATATGDGNATDGGTRAGTGSGSDSGS